MVSAGKTEIVDRLTGLAERAAAGTSIEIVELQLRGGGKSRLLRVYIDKPGGVTHGDCELVSEGLGRLLDEEDAVPGDSYTLEVSSPGADRRLSTRRDFERVTGQNLKLALRQPIEGQPRLEGRLLEVVGDTLILQSGVQSISVPLDAIQKASIKFEF
jgi:ribosome maturation factor RimP